MIPTEWKPTKQDWYAEATVDVACPRCGKDVEVPLVVHSHVNAAGELESYAAAADVTYHTCPMFEVVGEMTYDADTDSLIPAS